MSAPASGIALVQRRERRLPHQPLYGTTRHRDALAVQLTPELAGAVDTKVCGVDVPDLRLQRLVPHPPSRWASLPRCVVGGRGGLHHPADRLDAETSPVGINETGHLDSRGSSSRAIKTELALRISFARRTHLRSVSVVMPHSERTAAGHGR